jgi:glucose-6-phosphate dehydrogenase assembly protein OpcA
MTLAFQSSEPAQLEKAFRTLFGGMEQSQKDVAFRRASAANIVMVVSGVERRGLAEDFVHAFAGCRPSRIFIVVLDDKAGKVEVGVTALCHSLGKDLQVCSEIVELRTPLGLFASVPSIVRANLIFSAPTELVVLDPAVPEDVVRKLAAFCDGVVFDSNTFESRIDALRVIPQLSNQLLDLQWVGLGIWRDQIKGIFDRPAVKLALGGLASITIQGGTAGQRSPLSLLIAGWILTRLSLHSIAAPSNEGFECHRPGNDKAVKLAFAPSRGGNPSGVIEEIRFDFIPVSNGGDPKIERVRLVRNDRVLETLVEPGPSFKITRPFDDERPAARIQRYYLIGESTANYGQSLRMALALAGMSRKG